MSGAKEVEGSRPVADASRVKASCRLVRSATRRGNESIVRSCRRRVKKVVQRRTEQ